MTVPAPSHLAVVANQSASPPEAWHAFCSHCGVDPGSAARVCAVCGLGLVLRCPPSTAPEPRSSFLVVDPDMSIGAVSRAAEKFLGVEESRAVHRPLTELVVGADTENVTDLGAALAAACGGEQGLRELFVRPANTFGVRCRARIGPCGSPPAALLVLS